MLYSPALRYACHISGSLGRAEDAVQETFLKMYRSLRTGHTIDQPRAWVFTVLRREVLKRTAADARYQGLDPAQTTRQLVVPMPSDDTLDEDSMKDLLGCLSSREAEVLLLRLGNLKHREIGDQLGIGIKSVSTFLARALDKLRVKVGKDVRKEAATPRVRKSTRDALL